MSKLIAVLLASCMLISVAAAQAEDMKDMNMPANADMSKDGMKKGEMAKHHHMKKHMMKKDKMSKETMSNGEMK